MANKKPFIALFILAILFVHKNAYANTAGKALSVKKTQLNIDTDIFNSAFNDNENLKTAAPDSVVSRDQKFYQTLVQLQIEHKVREAIEHLSLEQKVGQLFIFGFRGTDFNEELAKMLNKYQPGAIIAFGSNIKNPRQVATLNWKAQQEALTKVGLPLFIMVDEEGGPVARIKFNAKPPSALAIGTADNPKLTEKIGFATGQILALLGFNVDLAPVMDLSNPDRYNFIGNRSFGLNPQKVDVLATQFARGVYRAGVLPTAKHFPGHGGIRQDSHKLLPVKEKSLKELQMTDLEPFRFLAKLPFPSAMMVAHLSCPKVDPSGLPASFSKVMVTDLLRKKLNYHGLVITDDLEMKGAASIGNMAERAVKAINAGNNMVMVAWNEKHQRLAYQGVLKAVREGKISKQRLEENLEKIVGLKLKLWPHALTQPPSRRHLHQRLAAYAHTLQKFSNKVVLANFKQSLKGSGFLKNHFSQTQPILVFSADHGFVNEVVKSASPHETRYLTLRKHQKQGVNEVMAKYPRALGIYYVSGLGTARRLRQIKTPYRRRLVVVNSTQPGAIWQRKSYLAVIDINTRNDLAGAWLTNYIFGRYRKLAGR